jgi:hypothetical protein
VKTSPIILGDMSAVRDKGAEYLSNNYNWPVSTQEFIEFDSEINECYVKLLTDLDDSPMYDIALVELSFVSHLVQIFHYNYVKEYAIENNVELLSGLDSYHYRCPNWEKLGSFYSDIEYPFGIVKRFIRRIIKNVFFNRHITLFNFITNVVFGREKIISIGSNDPIRHKFIVESNYFCDNREWIDLIQNKDVIGIDVNIEQEVDLIVKKVINPFLVNLRKHKSFFIKNIDFDEIKKIWIKRISDITVIYYNLYRIKKKPNKLLVTEVAKPLHKLITLAFQRDGVEVFCFHHGNDASYSQYRHSHEMTVSHCQYFLVPTKGIAKRYDRDYSHIPIEKRSNTKYISVEDNSLYKAFIENKKVKKRPVVNRIMIMGYPANSNRYASENGLFFYQKVDLEYRLINFLKNNGYYVIYKAHPDRLREVQGLFNNLVDEYIIEKFENVWHKADVFIFTYTSTSTFGYSLVTNRPILLLDNAKKCRNLSDYFLLKNRVNIIETDTRTNTRIIFDKHKLLKTLKHTHHDMTNEDSYVKEIFNSNTI